MRVTIWILSVIAMVAMFKYVGDVPSWLVSLLGALHILALGFSVIQDAREALK